MNLQINDIIEVEAMSGVNFYFKVISKESKNKITIREVLEWDKSRFCSDEIYKKTIRKGVLSFPYYNAYSDSNTVRKYN